ncbi:7980_t:CDS:2, partial [Gigaspora margarita]
MIEYSTNSSNSTERVKKKDLTLKFIRDSEIEELCQKIVFALIETSKIDYDNNKIKNQIFNIIKTFLEKEPMELKKRYKELCQSIETQLLSIIQKRRREKTKEAESLVEDITELVLKSTLVEIRKKELVFFENSSESFYSNKINEGKEINFKIEKSVLKLKNLN